MLRGFRWQLLAFALAAVLFMVSLLLRDSTPPSPSPTATIQGVVEVDIPVSETVIVQPTSEPNTSAVAPISVIDPIPTYREAVIGQLSRINPLFASLNPVDQDISALIFEGLVTTNPYGEPAPALAERWVISSDGLEYVVTLREGILWQDGQPFSAADVVYTMSLLRSPDFPGMPEVGAFWRTVETEALGDTLIRFRLTQPLGTFLERLRIGILPEHALRGTTAAQIATHPFNLTPIGTGAYQLEAIRADDNGTARQVDLRVSSNYRARPDAQPFTIERIRFQLYDTFEAASAALTAGEVDGLAGRNARERRPLFEIANNADLELHNQVEGTLGVLIFNWQSANINYFREQRIRVAFETGLDRSSLVERTLANSAVVADSPLMPLSWAYLADLSWATYNPVQARILLEQGIERLGRTSAPNDTTDAPIDESAVPPEATAEPAPTTLFSIVILTPDDPALVNLANEIATQWSQLNVTVSLESADLETYNMRLDSGDFDVALVEYSLGESADPDVYAFWHQGQYPDGRNYGGVDDRRISELLERARRDPYPANRVTDYEAFQREFVERAIAIPLYYPLYTYVTQARVEGVQLGFIGAPADRFRNIGDWRLE